MRNVAANGGSAAVAAAATAVIADISAFFTSVETAFHPAFRGRAGGGLVYGIIDISSMLQTSVPITLIPANVKCCE